MAYYDFDFQAPLFLVVGNNQEKRVYVDLGKVSGNALADHLLPKIDAIYPEYIEKFWGRLLGGIMAIDDLPQQYYMPVYHAIMQACDEIESLTPYKDALNKALRADPRFQEKQAA